jgi:glycosyltransferase involved in cell wall biosynthesis
MLPRVSIVVPSRDQASYLELALRSLVEQDYPNLELIVMDGGSTDGSVQVVECFADRIAYWQSEPDGGQAAALAEGFRRATGDVLGWLNSDDVLLPGALARVAEEFRNDPHCMWIYGNSHVIDRAGSLLWRRVVPQVSRRDLGQLSVYLPQESTFFRRDLYERAGGVDASLDYAMDYDLWLKFIALAPPRHVDAFLGCFRLLDGQKSSNSHRYREEERRVKARAGYTPLPTWQAAVGQAQLGLRAAGLRLLAEGWSGPSLVVKTPLRTLRGQTASLGPSKAIAGFGIGSATLAVLAAAAVARRSWRRRGRG